jgi:hypothetical protein
VSSNELIDIMVKLLSEMHPDADESTVLSLAAVAADAYLQHMGELGDEDRASLLVAVLEEVGADLP